MNQFKYLPLLYVNPMRAMSGILDEGNWLLSLLAALFVAAILSFSLDASEFSRMVSSLETQQRLHPNAAAARAATQQKAEKAAPGAETAAEEEDVPTAVPQGRARPVPNPYAYGFHPTFSAASLAGPGAVLMLLCIGVPIAVSAVTLFEHLGSCSTVLMRDFAPMLACCSLAWIAGYAPFLAASIFVTDRTIGQIVLPALGTAYFLFLFVCALRAVCGARAVPATGSAILGLVAAEAFGFVGALGFAFPLLLSPCLLIYGYRYFGGTLSGLGDGLRSRQSLRRHLEACTVNPRDADAHCQLGLIYMARRNYDQASEHFRRAIEIDPQEPEANLQLARIHIREAKFAEALKLIQTVVKANPKFSLHEGYREAGTCYIGMSRFNDAKPVLEHYVERRPYDPEGLFQLGRTYEGLNDRKTALETYARVIEAVRTAPAHRQRFISQWARLAQKRTREIKNAAKTAPASSAATNAVE